MRFLLVVPLLVSATTWAAQPAAAPSDLVHKVIANELRIESNDHTHWMYQVVNNIPAPRKTKIVVETTSGDVTYLDAIDGRPLTVQQRKDENERVQRFIHNPDEQRKARQAGQSDDRQSSELFAMLPDAFLFQFAGSTGDETKLTFHPNPNFTTHSSSAYVFHKMDGSLIVNTKENRLVEISGQLTNGVAFLGGLLGHLDPGGTFDVRRQEIAPSYWAITKLKVNMNGKILFFKTIAVQQDESHSDFQRIPDSTTLTQAEALAEKRSATPSAHGS
jgi:hypothetical protein